ncbi:MAG: alpha/beta hydrolase [Terriglobales bacterium]
MNPTPLALPVLIVLVALSILALSIRRIRSVGRLPHRKWRRVTERILLSLGILICAAATLTTTYSTIAQRYYQSIYKAPGKLYEVGGHKMHLYCTGAGAPTLVLETGWTVSALGWGTVQPELSKTTKVCSYDRAGYGWSEPQPGPRDADQIATQLHALLQQAGVTGPIIMIGHSTGGLYIRDYASHDPENLVGLIFVDAVTPVQPDQLSPELKADLYEIPSYEYYIFSVTYGLGIPRVVGECSKVYAGFEEHTERMLAESVCNSSLGEIWKEYKGWWRSFDETIHDGPYGDLVILIFSRDPQKHSGTGAPSRLDLEGERGVESNAGRLEETFHPQPENYFPGKWTRDTSRKA